MSIKSVSSVVSSSIVCEYPEKLKIILENSESPSDTLMKVSIIKRKNYQLLFDL